MKNIKTGTICALISMVSVVVMFIWGYLANDFSRSWLAVMIGGILSFAVFMIRKDLKSAEGDKDNNDKPAE
ncbi:MAG: hypothetical protein J5518_04700 [Lachnospiraceae bacterium]|nr:hypothetical protein [Lachnospiraceae bacterium]